MLDGLQLTLALGLPWLAAALFLLRWWPRAAPGRWPGVLGVGYFVAMFAVAGLLLAFDHILGGWHYAAILVLAGVLVLAGAWWAQGMSRTPSGGNAAAGMISAGWSDASPWVRVGVALLLALIAVRMGGWLIEVLYRPIYSWDAYYYWSYRARGFLEHGSAQAFVAPGELLRGEATGYGQGYRHPSLVSVIQLWPALALGRWHESLVNLPWFLAGVALGLVIFGYLRRLGLGVLPAMLAAYLTLSVPLLGVHIGVGGYADIWMAGVSGAAALALFALLAERRWQEGIVLVPLVLVLPFIKQSGILFSAAFLVAFVLGVLRPVWGLLLSLLLLAGFAIVVFQTGLDFHLPALGRVVVEPDRILLPRGGELVFDPQWSMFLQRLVVDGSWHLLFVLAAVLIVLAIPRAWREASHRALWVLVVALAVMTFVVYGATEQAERLADGTGFGRHLLPLVPVLAAWLVLFTARWLERGRPAAASRPS